MIMSGNEAWNRNVFRRWWKVDRDGAEITLSDGLYQMVGPVTGKARLPMVDSLTADKTGRQLVRAGRREHWQGRSATWTRWQCSVWVHERDVAMFIISIIIIIAMTMFMVLSSWPKLLREFTRFIWWMQTERWVAANTQTKPVDLGCESAENWQLWSTSAIAIGIITQPVSWFYRPTKGGRLSRPEHCSKGAQPVLKTVYRSSCRDKHNC